jgi:hypothetical protein
MKPGSIRMASVKFLTETEKWHLWRISVKNVGNFSALNGDSSVMEIKSGISSWVDQARNHRLSPQNELSSPSNFR